MNKKSSCSTISGMEEQTKKPKNKFHMFKHHLHNQENDIEFRGPLSYRHLRIIAWVCMMFMALSVVFTAFTKFKDSLETPATVFEYIGELALPLFLVANFSYILRNRKNIKKVILFYGLAALGMMFVAYGFLFRYYFTMTLRYNSDNYELFSVLLEVILNANVNKYVFLNVFIDLFLCSASYFFLTYQPKKFFKGKKLILFRLLVLLPIIYEIGCIYVKLHPLTSDTFYIHWYIFPLLTTKPPMLLLGFLILTIIFSFRKRIYLKKNQCGEEQYEKFLKTNANSLHFSIMTIAVLLFAVIVDVIVFVIVTSFMSNASGYELEVTAEHVLKSGLGKTIPVVIIFPILIFFSYSREYEDKIIDKIIPMAGVALCGLAAIESFVQIFASL